MSSETYTVRWSWAQHSHTEQDSRDVSLGSLSKQAFLLLSEELHTEFHVLTNCHGNHTVSGFDGLLSSSQGNWGYFCFFVRWNQEWEHQGTGDRQNWKRKGREGEGVGSWGLFQKGPRRWQVARGCYGLNVLVPLVHMLKPTPQGDDTKGWVRPLEDHSVLTVEPPWMGFCYHKRYRRAPSPLFLPYEDTVCEGGTRFSPELVHSGSLTRAVRNKGLLLISCPACDALL